jgi:hypothetical protein
MFIGEQNPLFLPAKLRTSLKKSVCRQQYQGAKIARGATM